MGTDSTSGREPLRIVQLTSLDAGMVVYRLHSALNTTTPHESLMASAQQDRVYGEPAQWHATRDRGVLRKALETADVIHCHLDYHIFDKLAAKTDAPVVMHHHGTMYRRAPSARNVQDERRADLRLVSNLELLQYGENLHFLPNPIPVSRYQRLAKERHNPDDTFRIAHSPSKRELKGTEDFLAAIARLRRKGENVQAVLIEDKTHAESLRIKATCDATFDAFWLGMQCSGLEAAAMGQPVIAGDVQVRDAYVQLFGECPYTFTNDTDGLGAVIKQLMDDKKYRAKETRRVGKYVLKNHDYAAVTARYLDLLDDAVGWRETMKLHRRRK